MKTLHHRGAETQRLLSYHKLAACAMEDTCKKIIANDQNGGFLTVEAVLGTKLCALRASVVKRFWFQTGRNYETKS